MHMDQLNHGAGLEVKDPKTCDTFVFGIVLQYILWYVPLYCTLIIGCVLYVIAIVTIFKTKQRLHGSD